jgi:hypothetical protein
VVVAAAVTGIGGLGGLLLGLGAVVDDIDAFAGSGSAGFSVLGVRTDCEIELEDFGNESGVFVVLGFAVMSTGFPALLDKESFVIIWARRRIRIRAGRRRRWFKQI